MMVSLNVGLVCDDSIYAEVLKEILNHQGILYKEIRKNSKTREKFSCIILARCTDENYELALRYCEAKNAILIVEKEIPLKFILLAFEGKIERSQNDLLYPIVNFYETILLEKIREVHYAFGLPFVRKWFWPNFYDVCCVITHDIDWLHYSPWHWAILRGKSILQLIRLAYQSIVRRRNFGNNVSEIISRETRKNIRSSFFFLHKYKEINQREFLGNFKELQEHGFGIGLHGYYSHDDLVRLKEQKATLEKYVKTEVKGIRQHELNFLTPLTWKYEEEAGFTHDLTFSYNKKFGFRSGICLPYHPINILENRRFSIIEMPTPFMDWTVLHKRMNYEEAKRMFAMIRKNVEKFNGLLVTCFHNTYLNKETFPEINKLYSSILADLSQRNYWITTANECYKWWLQRENTEVGLALKGEFISGRTTACPIPLIVENAKGEKKYVEIQDEKFRVNVG